MAEPGPGTDPADRVLREALAHLAAGTTHEVTPEEAMAALLRLAAPARTAVARAQGILMERHGIDAARAFAVLERLSRDVGTGLPDVADLVVEGTTHA